MFWQLANLGAQVLSILNSRIASMPVVYRRHAKSMMCIEAENTARLRNNFKPGQRECNRYVSAQGLCEK